MKSAVSITKSITKPITIPIPQKKGYTIYTKDGCAYCNLAKQLLNIYTPTIIDCNDLYLDNKTGFFEKMMDYTKKTHKTFPLIFHNGAFIGGYSEIKNILSPDLSTK